MVCLNLELPDWLLWEPVAVAAVAAAAAAAAACYWA